MPAPPYPAQIYCLSVAEQHPLPIEKRDLPTTRLLQDKSSDLGIPAAKNGERTLPTAVLLSTHDNGYFTLHAQEKKNGPAHAQISIAHNISPTSGPIALMTSPNIFRSVAKSGCRTGRTTHCTPDMFYDRGCTFPLKCFRMTEFLNPKSTECHLVSKVTFLHAWGMGSFVGVPFNFC